MQREKEERERAGQDEEQQEQSRQGRVAKQGERGGQERVQEKQHRGEHQEKNVLLLHRGRKFTEGDGEPGGGQEARQEELL